MNPMDPGRRYFDHAATTPMRSEVVEATLDAFERAGFNANSIHAEGRTARAALDLARDRVAAVLGARPREIVFTAGGSEADNLAILGVARARRGEGRHVLTVATEHKAVLHAFDELREDGYDVTVLGVDGDGLVDPAKFASALRRDTVLASVALANNELGTLAPVAHLAALARERGVIFHTDAVQATGRTPIDVRALGVDLLSLSAHKFYGPKGMGVLFVRAGTPLAPRLLGGGQEAGRRAGTEDVPGAVGLAAALELAVAELAEEAARLGRLQDRFETSVLDAIADVRVNAAGAKRVPHISSLAFKGLDAAMLAIRLDLAGFAVSTGSACAAGTVERSHVIVATAPPDWATAGTVRFSFGRLSSEQDVDALLGMLPETVNALRETAGLVGTIDRGPAMGLTQDRS